MIVVVRSSRAASWAPGDWRLRRSWRSSSGRWSAPAKRAICARTRSRWASTSLSGSISRPVRLAARSVSRSPISRSKASARLCAGSVDTSRTRRSRLAARNARAEATVVFPTPPLPPTINRRRRRSRVSISRAVWRFGSGMNQQQRKWSRGEWGMPMRLCQS